MDCDTTFNSWPSCPSSYTISRHLLTYRSPLLRRLHDENFNHHCNVNVSLRYQWKNRATCMPKNLAAFLPFSTTPLSFGAPFQWTPANIRINLTLPETRIIRLYFRRRLCASIFILFFCGGIRKQMYFETDCVMAVEGHRRSLILSKARSPMQLSISHQ